MEFAVTFDGVLPTTRANREIKHHLRLSLHLQMKALFEAKGLAGPPEFRTLEPGHSHSMVHEVRGKRFVSLVCANNGLFAELNVTMLRPDPTNNLIVEGDIDNRLKVLFDVLSVPRKEQLPTDWTPTSDQEPVYCLLEDDQRITRVSLQTHQWFDAPAEDRVRLFVKVNVKSGSFIWTSGGPIF